MNKLSGPPIGSEFESLLSADPHYASKAHSCFRHNRDLILTQTGRQALTWIIQNITDAAQIHLPEYLCESMATPFIDAGLNPRFYSLDRDLMPDLASFKDVRSNDIVLISPYFGRPLPAEIGATLDQLHTCDVTIIADETHSIFEPPSGPFDFRFASLRKLLPVSDGAYIKAPRGGPDRLMEPDPTAGHRRTLAAITKRVALEAGDDRLFDRATSMFRRGEEELTSRLDPHNISRNAIETLSHLNYVRLAESRRRNARALLRALRQMTTKVRPLGNYSDAVTPAYLTCTVPDPIRLQSFLAQAAIYCPIHWPRPSIVSPRRWRSDLISFPIDHRYSEVHMHRIAETVATFEGTF